MSVSLDALVLGDDADAWRDAGFTVVGDECIVGTTRLVLTGSGGGVVGWRLRGVTVDTVDGIPTEVSTADPPDEATHPNRTIGFDHVVVTTPDHHRTQAAFEAIGVACRRVHDVDETGGPFEQRFYRLGAVIAEVIGPPEPTGDAPAGFFGLALNVDDIDATAAHYRSGELGRVKDAVQPGRRIATLRHKTFGIGIPIAFMSI